jgi:hypothetical protein
MPWFGLEAASNFDRSSSSNHSSVYCYFKAQQDTKNSPYQFSCHRLQT